MDTDRTLFSFSALNSFVKSDKLGPMERSKRLLTTAEFFAGIGLVRMGLEPHGWQVVFANDISEKKCEMYKAFFPDAEAHYTVGDIFEIDPASIPAATLATCSFPCIDLSLAGNMNGMFCGRHSSAFWGFIKILKAQGDSAPPLVLVENVPGWLHSNKGKDFRVTVQALNELGYACDVFILDAMRFTPQSRVRVFLLGTRPSVTHSVPELILMRPKSLVSEQLKKSITANRDLQWFYNEIPDPPPLNSSGLSQIIEPMSHSDSRWWSEEETNRHIAMMEKSHRERVMQLAQGQQISYRTFFRRRREGQQRAEVRDDDLSGCLRTAVGGSGKQFLIRAGGGRIRMRAMTPREYARLQGVPDEYPITVNGVQALTGFGDAVCVPAISWIAEHILNPLAQNGSPRYQYNQPGAQFFLFKNGRQPYSKRPPKDNASRQRQGHKA
jgi:DNA (cytosine-5)-methyltransferase 1